jgi:biopolymer transport protein ExbD
MGTAWAKDERDYVAQGGAVAFMQADGNVEFAYVAEAVAMTQAAGAGRIGLFSDRKR